MLAATFKDRQPKSLPEVYAQEQILLHENPTAEIKLQAIRIGELGITAIPDEVFAITGHPKAKRCYAWGHVSGDDDQARRYVCVLELPPVDSPETAVRAGIMSEIKKCQGSENQKPVVLSLPKARPVV